MVEKPHQRTGVQMALQRRHILDNPLLLAMVLQNSKERLWILFNGLGEENPGAALPDEFSVGFFLLQKRRFQDHRRAGMDCFKNRDPARFCEKPV